MPVTYTQANRAMRVETPLGEDVLLLNGFSGYEGISQLASFQLELLSTDPDIDAADLLGKPAVVVLRNPERNIHGRFRRFTQLGRRDDLVFYRAEIVPWLWFLTVTRESRIYQELSTPEILEQVFKRLGFSDFKFRLTRSYLPRTYCVQYRETHFNFVSRLMEEEGIFYFFEHDQDKHTLILADHPDPNLLCAVPGEVRYAGEPAQDEVVWEFENEYSVQAGKVTLWDYCFETPNLNLEATYGDELEIYDYPGGYAELDAGDRQARVLLEAEECERQVVHGESNVQGFIPGFHFSLFDHYRNATNGKYLVTHVQHRAHADNYRGWDEDAGISYTNTFQCIPEGVPYRPARRTQRPFVYGAQTAVVVGPAGEEVYVDKYGRIKVQFHWDRDGKRNENSSCWIRVLTPWGGRGWGSVTLPRIGAEVLCAFEQGDPDRPYVIGSVYNADQMPPFELPGAGIQMGMKSRSSPGGGGFNEITMTDTKGKEMMNIHAQYDMVTTVENDHTLTVHNNRKTTVDVDDTENIGVNQKMAVGSNQELTVGANQKIAVAANQETSIGANATLSVAAGRKTSIGASDSLVVAADHVLSAGGKNSMSSGANTLVTSAAGLHLNAGGEATLVAGGSIKVTGSSILLSGGGSTIEIGPGGVTITTGGTVNVTGAAIKHNS